MSGLLVLLQVQNVLTGQDLLRARCGATWDALAARGPAAGTKPPAPAAPQDYTPQFRTAQIVEVTMARNGEPVRSHRGTVVRPDGRDGRMVVRLKGENRARSVDAGLVTAVIGQPMMEG